MHCHLWLHALNSWSVCSWQQEADTTLRKARALKAQRREEYEKAHSSTNRSQEEQSNAGNKQLEKKRRIEEEALQKVGRKAVVSLFGVSSFYEYSSNASLCWFGQAEEAQDQYQNCMADAGVRKMDLDNAKRTFLTQIREMIFQCDLTLKAVRGSYNSVCDLRKH